MSCTAGPAQIVLRVLNARPPRSLCLKSHGGSICSNSLPIRDMIGCQRVGSTAPTASGAGFITLGGCGGGAGLLAAVRAAVAGTSELGARVASERSGAVWSIDAIRIRQLHVAAAVGAHHADTDGRRLAHKSQYPRPGTAVSLLYQVPIIFKK